LRNTGSTIRHQGSGRPRALMTTLILSVNWFWVRPGRCTKESRNHTSNFTRDRNSSLFGIAYRLSESEVEMLEEASCARTPCCKLCVALNSRTKTAMSFRSVRYGRHICHLWGCVKLVDDIINTWSDLSLCFAFISNLTSDFAALCLCQQWLYLACFLLALQLNFTLQYKIWEVCFVANFLCCNIAKYF